MLPARFRIIWSSGFRGEELKKISQSETICLLMDRDGMSSLYRGPSIDASY